tara:strand:+ start:307 stop:1320 length:1014 start_codon:yes stop_codon:yes gene_type:complete
MIILFNFLIINFLIILKYDKIADLIDTYDFPDKKLKLHKSKTPILGGLIILINYFVFVISSLFYENSFLVSSKTNEIISIAFLVIGFFIVGFYDDRKKLSPLNKLFYLIIILLLGILINENLIIEKISITFFKNKIFFEIFSIPFSIFCIIILINALNFFDGINGQSCIFFLIVFSFLSIKSNFNIFYILNIFTILFILFLNLKNKLFLGDGGIFLLTIVFSISIIFEHRIGNIIYADEIFFLLLLPGIDLIRLTLVRLYKGNNPFYGDRDHLHHLLMNKFSLFTSNLILFIFSIFPICFFYLISNNFFLIFVISIFKYSFTILFLKSNVQKQVNKS